MPNLRLLVVSAALAAASNDAPAQNQPWLHAPVVLERLPGVCRHLGDVDHDGDVDAIAFRSTMQNAIQNSFTVMRNDGAGNLIADASVPLPGGIWDDSALGDVDGDGFADLVLETHGSAYPQGYGVLIVPGLQGGTFAIAQPIHVPLPGTLYGIEIGNGNGDGIDDIFVMHAVASATYEQRWIFGASDFALTPEPPSPAPFGRRTLLDADGDGIDDVAYRFNPGGGQAQVVIEATTGSGFTTILTLPVALNALDEVSAVDIDGDGDDDLVGSRTSGVAGIVITTITNAGGGFWPVATRSYPGAKNGKLWPGDWDGDGINDLVMRTNGQAFAPFFRDVALYHNDGQGGFELRHTQRIHGNPLGFTAAYGAGTCDLDGDGNLDFVGSNAIVFGDGTIADPLGGPAALPSIDWDDDGDVDSTIQGLRRNDGGGNFGLEPFQLPAPPAGHTYSDAFVITDFDGDGLHELLVELLQFVPGIGSQFVATVLLRETVDLQFVDAGFAAAPGLRIDGIIVDDADDDGDLDVIGQSGVWQNDGTEHFTLLGPGFGNYRPVRKADLDGDGRQDLLALAPFGSGAAVLYRTGAATYATTVLAPTPGVAMFTDTADFADVDDDGDMDVVGIDDLSSSPQQGLIYENQGGVLALAATLPHRGLPLVADFDGDGLTDLGLFLEYLRVLRRTGPGLIYEPAVAFATPSVLRMADVDQDGDLDAVGARVVRNNTFAGAMAGARRQYQRGGLGAVGRRPVLSMTGILREGQTPAVRLRNAPGSAPAILMVGTGEDNIPSPVLSGVQAYVSGVYLLLGLTCGGPPGQAGLGGLDLPVAIPAGVGGSRLFFEFLVLDATLPAFLSYSNGCEILVGQ